MLKSIDVSISNGGSLLTIRRNALNVFLREFSRSLLIFLVSLGLFQTIMVFVFGIKEMLDFLFYLIFLVPLIYGWVIIILNELKVTKTIVVDTNDKSLKMDRDIRLNLSDLKAMSIKKVKSQSYYNPFALEMTFANHKPFVVLQTTSKR